MPLQEFLQQKGIRPLQATTQVGSLTNFLGQQGLATTTPTEVIEKPKEEEKSKIGTAFNWLGKQLMKPTEVVAKELRGVGEVIGNLLSIASPKVSAEKA